MVLTLLHTETSWELESIQCLHPTLGDSAVAEAPSSPVTPVGSQGGGHMRWEMVEAPVEHGLALTPAHLQLCDLGQATNRPQPRLKNGDKNSFTSQGGCED